MASEIIWHQRWQRGGGGGGGGGVWVCMKDSTKDKLPILVQSDNATIFRANQMLIYGNDSILYTGDNPFPKQTQHGGNSLALVY